MSQKIENQNKEKKKRKKEEKKKKEHEKKKKRKDKERKRRRKERERMRKANPDISLSSSSDSDLDSSSSSSGGDDEEKHKKQIDKMLKDANKDDPYKHQKEIDKIKQQMGKNKDFKRDLLRDLGIPAFDKNEEVKFEVPDDDEEFEKLEENKRIKADKLAEHNRIADYVNKLNINKLHNKLKGKAKWAIYARSIYEFIHLLRMIRSKEIKKREDFVKAFSEGLLLYVDVGKAWVIKWIKPTLLSLLQDQTISLDFVDATSSAKIDSAFLKAKVRVEAIVKSIHKNINAKDVPYPFIAFLDSLTWHNAFIPNNFLTPFEIHRLNINKYGALQNPSHEAKQMLIGFFIIGKIMIGKIFLNPGDIGVNIKVNEKKNKEEF